MAFFYITTVAALGLVLLFLRAVLDSWRIQRKLPPGTYFIDLSIFIKGEKTWS